MSLLRLIPHFVQMRHICGMTKGPRRHKETWWWNEEVAEAVSDKKIKNGGDIFECGRQDKTLATNNFSNY